MLKVAVVTIFPDMFSAVTGFGVVGRAADQGLLDLALFNPRDYTRDTHRTVDDRPYGGGPGMVMRFEPLAAAIDDAKRDRSTAKVVYLSPQGRKITQEDLNVGQVDRELVLVCGRYEGVDERLIQSRVDEEWSLGDYVLSGGELPAMVVIDAMCRTVPGVLGHEESAEQDSFSEGLLDHPHYTRPEEIDGEKVPEVLLGGNHEKIKKWRMMQSLGRTMGRRPDLLEKLELDENQQRLLDEYINGAE